MFIFLPMSRRMVQFLDRFLYYPSRLCTLVRLMVDSLFGRANTNGLFTRSLSLFQTTFKKKLCELMDLTEFVYVLRALSPKMR